MKPNLIPLSRMFRNKNMNKLISFDIENAKLIADLVYFKLAEFLDFRENIQIFADDHSFLMLYYPKKILEENVPDIEEGYNYYHLNYLDEVLGLLNTIIVTSRENENMFCSTADFSKHLENWVLLKPRYLDHKIRDFFIRNLNNQLNAIDTQKDLSKKEIKLINNWLKLEENEFGMFYRYI